MISVGLERRLAVVATAALTLAIWVLPASATSGAGIHLPEKTSGSTETIRAEPRHRGMPHGLQNSTHF
jgi:hypothetical protein